MAKDGKDEKVSDDLAAERFGAFQHEVDSQVDAIKKQHGGKLKAVEKIIRKKGYEPDELGVLVGAAGATGKPGTAGGPERVFEEHQEVFRAVAEELGVEIGEGR